MPPLRPRLRRREPLTQVTSLNSFASISLQCAAPMHQRMYGPAGGTHEQGPRHMRRHGRQLCGCARATRGGPPNCIAEIMQTMLRNPISWDCVLDRFWDRSRGSRPAGPGDRDGVLAACSTSDRCRNLQTPKPQPCRPKLNSPNRRWRGNTASRHGCGTWRHASRDSRQSETCIKARLLQVGLI